MARRRRVTLHNLHDLPINLRALKRLIYRYYKGPQDIVIKADHRLEGWADYDFDLEEGVHVIRLNPWMCTHNRGTDYWDPESQEIRGSVVKMNRRDTVCRIINTLLHEIKHANQYCEMGAKVFDKISAELHPDITQSRLKYELAPLERDAEAWALLHFQKALDKYDEWTAKYEESD